jgi:hypothetical protein
MSSPNGEPLKCCGGTNGITVSNQRLQGKWRKTSTLLQYVVSRCKLGAYISTLHELCVSCIVQWWIVNWHINQVQNVHWYECNIHCFFFLHGVSCLDMKCSKPGSCIMTWCKSPWTLIWDAVGTNTTTYIPPTFSLPCICSWDRCYFVTAVHHTDKPPQFGHFVSCYECWVRIYQIWVARKFSWSLDHFAHHRLFHRIFCFQARTKVV